VSGAKTIKGHADTHASKRWQGDGAPSADTPERMMRTLSLWLVLGALAALDVDLVFDAVLPPDQRYIAQPTIEDQ